MSRRLLVLLLGAAAGVLLAAPAAPAAAPAPAGWSACGAPCFIHVSFHGSGSGRVVSTWTDGDGGHSVECRRACVVLTDFGVVVTMTAFSDEGSFFGSLVGPECQNTDPSCTFFMDYERDVFVTFDGVGLPQPPPSEPPALPPPILPSAAASPPAAGPRSESRCTIVGTERGDLLTATRANDVICGLGGDDHIHVGGGRDIVYAGPGNDEIEAGFGVRAVIHGGAGADRIEGGPGNDRLLGDAGADRVVGRLGRDVLIGGAGPDRIDARDGRRDIVDGGTGRDVARTDRLDRVRIVERRIATHPAGHSSACAGPCTLNVLKLGTGSGTVRGAGGQIDCGSACVAQTDYDVWLTLTATPSPGSVFTGWVGDCQPASGNRCDVHMVVGPINFYGVFDRIGDPPTPLEEPGSGPQPPASPPPPPPPGTPNPRGCTITGTQGPDFLAGTSGRDVICGLGGNDHVHAGRGNDVVYGDAGNDDVEAHGGNDRVYGGAGRDLLEGGNGIDLLVGGAGRDRLLARDGLRDTVNGGADRDTGRTDRRDRVRAVEARLF